MMTPVVSEIVVPQVNVNDAEVRLVSWLVEHGAHVHEGDDICTVETSKAAVVVAADRAGFIVPVAAVGAWLPIGATLAHVGPTVEAAASIAAQRIAASPLSSSATPRNQMRVTKRAAAMALEHGIDLAAVAAAGVTGAVKEADVERFLAGRQKTNKPSAHNSGNRIPPGLLPLLGPAQKLSRHDVAVAQSLRYSFDHALLTSLDYEIPVDVINAGIERHRREGTALWLQHAIIAAAGRALPEFRRLMSFRVGESVYTYRDVHIGFVVKDRTGRLFTPVVRNAGSIGIREVARVSTVAAMRIRRGAIREDELTGACFTISQISDARVVRFVPMPNRFQSAILAVGGERRSAEGAVVTLTLTYDHGLCDGVYAAAFLGELTSGLELVVQ